jgi:hypothetical protein
MIVFCLVISQTVVRNMATIKKCFEELFGNHKAENYHEIVSDLLMAYKATGCNMSLKVHFLDCHLDLPRESWRHQ